MMYNDFQYENNINTVKIQEMQAMELNIYIIKIRVSKSFLFC